MLFLNSTSVRALAMGLAASTAISAPAFAQATASIDIPAQSVVGALEAFGRQTNSEVIFDRARLANLQAPAVKGELTPSETLKRLLVGTGLRWEQINEKTFVVKASTQGLNTSEEPALSRPAVTPVSMVTSEDIQEVIVVGARASQQRAIDRKRNAKTAVDSIVADDVGSFPDRNLSEALSRIPGMQMPRNETGEGEGVNVRGNDADLTRVEMDGMSVNSSGAGLAIDGANGGGRGADMRELPADLIKSVDVIKGQTPDLTEGGLGGTVQIQTRTGLDFKKPYLSMRVSAARNSLSQKWAPDINLVASRKFLDNRLGVVFNLTSTKRLNDSHQINGSGSSNAQGYARSFDFDNSPGKTFQYDPSLVTGEAANRPIRDFALANGTGRFQTLTPVEVVTRAANAKTKADCVAAFPLYSEAQLATMAPGTNNADRALVQATQINSQVACLNQWNDYSPASVRDVNLTQYEDRLAWDVRFDYRVSDHLTIYAKYQVNDRMQDDIRRNRTRGGISTTTDAQFLTQSLTNNTNIPYGSTNNLLLVPGGGYYLYNLGYPTSARNLDRTLGGSNVQMAFPVNGIAVNVDPATVVVDENHHLISADFTNGRLSYDNIRNEQIWKNNYLLLGGEYKKGDVKLTFQANRSESSYSRYDRRMSRGSFYGNGHMEVMDSGLWDIQLPEGFDTNNMSNSVNMAAATAVGMPSYSNSINIQLTPAMTEGVENAAKFDLTYRMRDIPFFTSFKTGASYRKVDTDRWGGGGFTPKAGVEVPTNTLRGSIRACENLSTTTAINSCAYGYAPGTGRNTLYGTETVTRAQLISILENSVEVLRGDFMPGYDGVEGMSLWDSIDVDAAYAQMAGALNYNFNCMKVCTGSDGNLYNQPVSRSTEEITAAYYMVEFEQALPWGMSIDGNFGVRMVESSVNASGNMSLASIRKNFSDDGNPNNDWNENEGNGRVTTTTISQPVAFQRQTRDWLPSYNAALRMLDDKLVLRYSWSRAVSRPPIGRLWPTGTCTIDQRTEDLIDLGDEDLDMTCSSTIGNPELKPYTATKNNTSLEWYPNKDTSISLAYYRQKVKIGAPESYTTTTPLFAGTGYVDPVTGVSFSDFDFRYTTYRNGPGNTQSGWEFSSKTAFTFLPWHLRYTGADFNVSTNDVKGQAGYIDPLTGESLGAPNRSKYFANLALWFDDGRTNARLAIQSRDRVFRCVSGCGNSIDGLGAFPNQNPRNTVATPYNPGEPYYTAAYTFVDAKVTHKVSENVELYWEGRNLTKQATILEGTRGFTDGDNQWSASYGGRRFTVGVTYRN
ncbi:TonB-dependent receptor [Asticcacaulis sp. W401b]|uniref:TonB-dependent receptor n=1 Tax=Asticcacaulis sp. W401b TaxID=3388666 RepID=UPI003970FD9E